MRYVVAGPSIVNDLTLADGKMLRNVLGGSIFCVAGILPWDSDCTYVSNVGDDFGSFYGPWMQSNKLTKNGLSTVLPHTWHTALTYGENGLHDETSVYGPEDEQTLEDLDVISVEQVARACSRDTVGVYVEVSEQSPFWQGINLLRNATDALLMWEMPTSAATDSTRRERVLETLSLCDLFSINLPEAKALFSQSTEEGCIEKIIDMGRGCYFHVGAKGSYAIQDGKVAFSPSVPVDKIVDVTGCGNASTAAALVGFARKEPLERIARMGNVSASFNLRQYGPSPCMTDKTREEARTLLGNNEA